jgi:8-oxo-dGTP pyrophosphatase MutT (NUDIX family)
MNQILYFAQKGLILDPSGTKLLMILYSDAKYNLEIKDKFGLPGGRIEFGENLDEAFAREIMEETGIVAKASDPVYIWTWTYDKEDTKVQIVATARIGTYVSGEINQTFIEEEVNLGGAFWKDISELNEEIVIKDEWPAIQKLIQSQSQSKNSSQKS